MSNRMPFGKIRGVLLADLPDNYICWLSDLDDLREPLRSGVAQEMRARFGSVAAPGPEVSPAVHLMAQELISAGLRILTKRHHPDLGGETRTMQVVNGAAEWLRGQLRRSGAEEGR